MRPGEEQGGLVTGAPPNQKLSNVRLQRCLPRSSHSNTLARQVRQAAELPGLPPRLRHRSCLVAQRLPMFRCVVECSGQITAYSETVRRPTESYRYHQTTLACQRSSWSLEWLVKRHSNCRNLAEAVDRYYSVREDLSSRDAAIWASARSDVFPSKGGTSEHATPEAGLG